MNDLLSTEPTWPTELKLSELERSIIEKRLATADEEPRQDAREAIAEIRHKLRHSSPR
jgi:hypothetical protein